MINSGALLCESCGYSIGELPREGRCPECGRAIVESLPERRVGTAWQQKKSAGAWARTVGMLLRSPRLVWDVVRAELPASGDLLTLHCWLAAAGVVAVVAAPLLFSSAFSDDWVFHWVSLVIYGFIAAFMGMLALMALCLVEYAGIRFFGRRNRWRITHEVAMAVIGHASVGWLLLPITLPACWWFASSGMVGALNGARSPGPIAAAATVTAAFAGPLIPLLAFEVLVYLGLRRMRFANVERPAEAE